MSTNTPTKFSLIIIAFSLLTACGGGGSDSNKNVNNEVINNYNNSDDKDIKDDEGITPVDTIVTDYAEEPNLIITGANPQYVGLNGTFIDLGATSYDGVDGDLTASITETNNVNTSVAGCYQQTYLVSDSDGNSNSVVRTVLVGTNSQRHSPNTPPITQEISMTGSYNTVSTIQLLDSAYDVNCDPLRVSSITAPTSGSTYLNSDGTVSFDPEGIVGSHSFNYTVSDDFGGDSTSGVTIASPNPNDGNDNWPTVVNEIVTISKNTSVYINVLDNDYDADGDALVLDQVDTPQHGTVSKSNGRVYYTPNPNYTGEDYFYYGVHDNHGHNGSGLVTISIN